ncbi:hypothetical protein PM10SUCC1_33100 [Propionigenium maris DSM 9537]|uniref:Uncharacterized protein n=1 Tax=Propionigenium maris DSM 9537 TaxID=1123000 RepID=A0A9W6LNW3_9FUSO|nr:hypothetical protein PM10SUCC1_33100 [Propionigenium maris DSM 9537]
MFQHVAGKTDSSWVSVTHNKEIAIKKYASQPEYKEWIKIDFGNLPKCPG